VQQAPVRQPPASHACDLKIYGLDYKDFKENNAFLSIHQMAAQQINNTTKN